MTTYNGGEFLREQLDSMLEQSRPVNELVVCDDGSVDNTIEILKEFTARAPFSVNVLINEHKLGSTKNFEKAISLCSGDIIVLCDQDDVWLPNKIAVFEKMFEIKPDCGMVFTDGMVVDENNIPLYRLWKSIGFDKKRQRMFMGGNALLLFIGGNVVTGATAAIRKTFFEEAIPFPPYFVHDHWLATIAVLKRKLVFNTDLTIHYRKHSSQQLGTPEDESWSERFNNVFNFEKSISSMRLMQNELDRRFHLTERDKKIFRAKINFYAFRSNLPANPLIRFFQIIKNLFCGDYHKFASGFLSALKDICPGNKG